MLALVGVLAVCVAGYGLISGMREESTGVTQEEGAFALLAWAQEEITGLRWENEHGAFDFVREDGVWVRRDEPAFPVNQTALDALAGRMAELTGTRELTDVADAADYGLSEPAFSVTVAGDGGEVTFAMGDETPFGDGYYVSASDREALYTVSGSLAQSFDKTPTQLCELEALPEAENVTRLTVGEALDAVRDGETGAWAQTGEPLDAEGVEALIADVKGIAWSALVTAQATQEQLTAWGLDEAQATRVALSDGDQTVFELCLGGEDEDGYRYARLPDSDMVYTVYADDVADLLDAGVDTLWQKEPVTAAFDTLSGARLACSGGEVIIERVAEATGDEADGDNDGEDDENDEGGEGERVSVTVNGAADEDGEAEALWKQVCALKGTKRIAFIAEGEPMLTLSFTQASGGQGGASLYAYDVDSYLLPVTDTHGLLVSADDVDRIIRTLRQMSAPEQP